MKFSTLDNLLEEGGWKITTYYNRGHIHPWIREGKRFRVILTRQWAFGGTEVVMGNGFSFKEAMQEAVKDIKEQKLSKKGDI